MRELGGENEACLGAGQGKEPGLMKAGGKCLKHWEQGVT